MRNTAIYFYIDIQIVECNYCNFSHHNHCTFDIDIKYLNKTIDCRKKVEKLKRMYQKHNDNIMCHDCLGDDVVQDLVICI